jgi:hypothetical protein
MKGDFTMNLLSRLVVHLFALLRYLALPGYCSARSAPTTGIRPAQVSFNRSWTSMLTALAVVLSFIGVAPAQAATFTVTNLNDSRGGSLRQAIMDANAAEGRDTITFSVSGTIPLGSTLPTITDIAGLTMDGTGQTVTISGGNAVRVLFVNPGASLSLNDLTIANGIAPSGNHGGGIFNSGILTVTNSTFSGNSTTTGYGGGINNNGTGTLTVTNSTFSGNSAPSAGGGGIMNSGTLTVTNSTFSGNSAPSSGNGGGIYNNSGTAAITNSSFSVNSAANWGGGIYVNAGAVTLANSTFSSNSAFIGGGIYIYTGAMMTLTNSTFSGNSATWGGGIYNLGTLNITNSTFSGNSASPGGGIFTDGTYGGTATLRNTIVANNTGANCVGTITNGGNNIDDGTTCGWGAASGSMSSTNPMLGALANNGGPTKTFALLTGSPAINGVTFNAPNSAPSTDQRGVSRPRGARYDIGAYERNVPDLTPILMLLLD